MTTSRELLSGDLADVRDAVHEAARGVTERYGRAYFIDCVHSKKFPEEMWAAMGEQGLLGLGVPEEYGGSGGGLVEVTAAMEALSMAGVPMATFLLTAFARETILRHGNEEQKARFVAPTATGESRMAFAITEPNAGTNSWRIETTALRNDAGNYVLNGQKVFISAADSSEHMMVVCRSTKLSEVEDRRAGMAIVVIDMNSPGIELQPLDIVVEIADQQFAVFFTDVEVPAENVIGEPDQAFRYMFDALNPERVLTASWGIGIGDYALAKAVAYTNERAPFGKPIGSYQGLQHPMARAKARLDAARLMMYTAARLFDEGGDAGYLANAAKLLGSEAGVEACDVAIQAHGGYAFDREFDVMALWPLARVLRNIPINNEMILNYIGEHVLGLPRSY